jgi:DNA-binding transcriptional MerR regulator
MALEQRKQRAPLKAEKKSQPGSAARTVAIPDKLYFRIGEVAQLCGLPTHVLRFWETEFPQLKPNKGGTGQRLYRRQDVELVLELQRLLHEEKFTIAGARRLLAEKRRNGSAAAKPKAAHTAQPQMPDLQKVRGELRAILGLLRAEVAPRLSAHPQRTSSPEHKSGAKTRRAALAETPTLFG